MNTITTTVKPSDYVTGPATLEGVQRYWEAGVAYQESGRSRCPKDAHPAFLAGFKSAAGGHTDTTVTQAATVDHFRSQGVLTLAEAEAVVAAADALIEDTAEASMMPLLDHHSSQELLAAVAEIERYGKFQPSGAFSPMLRRPISEDARPFALAAGMQQAMAERAVRKQLGNLQRSSNVLGRLTLAFGDDEAPTDPQLVFMAYPTASRAFSERRKAGGVMYYVPNEYVVPATGEVRASWFNDAGIAGFCLEFDTLDQLDDAASDARRALGVIRRAAREAERAEYDGWAEDDDARRGARPPRLSPF